MKNVIQALSFCSYSISVRAILSGCATLGDPGPSRHLEVRTRTPWRTPLEPSHMLKRFFMPAVQKRAWAICDAFER